MNQTAFAGISSRPVLDAADVQLKFAELMARAFLDPATASRYEADPAAVLGEFGIALRAGERAPRLPRPVGAAAVREEFAGLGPAGACLLTLCINDQSTAGTVAAGR